MSDQVTFYTHPMSRGRIVRWMLEELGQPYLTQVLDYDTTMKGAEYLAVNPMGKVPAIKHGDIVVTEAAAICAYLADAFPQAGLAPPLGDKARGPYFRWMFFAAGPMESTIANKSLGFVVPDDRRATAGWGAYEDLMTALETAVTGREFLAGDRFTAADVYFGASLGWGIQFAAIEARPALADYLARVSARPAASRAREIDDALLAG